MAEFNENIISYKNKKPKIDENVYINPYAIVIGDVTLHTGVSLWPGVIIRADDEQIEVGKNSILLDNTYIDSRPKQPVVIGEEVLISHQVTLHGCCVKSGVVIGKKANIMEGVEIGEESVIMDEAFIPPNTHIPSRSKFSGALGKIIGQVTDDEVKQIKQKHAEILQKSREYGNWFVAKQV
jgi:carbonic anhydrase/acetyltransferase-like protein (isoleucine patch superfamily)